MERGVRMAEKGCGPDGDRRARFSRRAPRAPCRRLVRPRACSGSGTFRGGGLGLWASPDRPRRVRWDAMYPSLFEVRQLPGLAC